MTRKEIRSLDRSFSLYIRHRGKCERCGSRRNLQTSHIYSRRYLSIRHHPLNAFCLCAGHHLWWHHRPADAVEWAKAYMGPDKWETLRLLANSINKSQTSEQIKGRWS